MSVGVQSWSDIEEFARAQAGLRSGIEGVAGRLPGGAFRRESAAPLVEAVVGSVVPAAFSIAEDFYRVSREASGVSGEWEFVAAAGVSDAALGFAFVSPGEVDASRLMRSVATAVLRGMRQSVALTGVKGDSRRPRFARVPVGVTCAFCTMLGSRGPVYRDLESAGGIDRFHDNCDCQIVPSWRTRAIGGGRSRRVGLDLPEYGVDALWKAYLAGPFAPGSS